MSLQALTNIDGIIAKSQALMVARGDLGVELELERVPFAQKLLIRKAKAPGGQMSGARKFKLLGREREREKERNCL